jgi:hypothetical protein
MARVLDCQEIQQSTQWHNKVQDEQSIPIVAQTMSALGGIPLCQAFTAESFMILCSLYDCQEKLLMGFDLTTSLSIICEGRHSFFQRKLLYSLY